MKNIPRPPVFLSLDGLRRAVALRALSTIEQQRLNTILETEAQRVQGLTDEQLVAEIIAPVSPTGPTGATGAAAAGATGATGATVR